MSVHSGTLMVGSSFWVVPPTPIHSIPKTEPWTKVPCWIHLWIFFSFISPAVQKQLARLLACLLLPAWCVDSRLLKQEEMVTQQTRAELLGRVVCWGVGSRWRCSSPAVYLPAEMDSNALMFEVFMAVKGLPFSETAFSIQLSHVPQHWVRFCLFGWVCVCVLGRQCSFVVWYSDTTVPGKSHFIFTFKLCLVFLHFLHFFF